MPFGSGHFKWIGFDFGSSIVCECVHVYTDDSGVIVGFSFEYSSAFGFDSGSMSIRLALCQTTTSIINAKNIIPDVVPNLNEKQL